MEQPKTCTYSYNGTICPIGAESCAGCGWDGKEAKWRKSLPLVMDTETGKSRKYFGRKPDDFPKVAPGKRTVEMVSHYGVSPQVMESD